MKNKMKGMAAVILVSVFILSGCGTSMNGLGSMFKLDLQNRTLSCKLDAGLIGLETSSGDSSGKGTILFDVELDWKNKDIRCRVDTDSSDSGNSELDFFLNWQKRDVYCSLDSEYPSTKKEKAAGAPDINSFHFDFLLAWQKKKLDANLNVGPYDLHLPLSEESGTEGGTVK